LLGESCAEGRHERGGGGESPEIGEEGGAAGDAQEIGVGQRVAEDRLIDDAGGGEGCADE
jgi:hypothetical protein